MYKKLLSNFSPGVNLSSTALQLGLDSHATAWASGLNVELYNRFGICRQNGNVLLTRTPENAAVTSLFTVSVKSRPDSKRILYTTQSGEFWEYDCDSDTHTCLKTGLQPNTPSIYTLYIGGVAVANGVDEPFFYTETNGVTRVCNMRTVAKDGQSPIIAEAMCAHQGRLWLAAGDTLYYSALGTYDDWETAYDAGFISNFHCDSTPVTALKPYKDYIAVYKKNQTYLLSGSSPDDFAIVPFADKGAAAQDAVVTAANRQYFFSDALFCLEQTGILSQITLGNEASLNIKPVLNGKPALYKTFTTQDGNGNSFTYFAGGALDKTRLGRLKAVAYERKNQLWFYIPTQNNDFINNVWIYDQLNSAWTLRALPQPILSAAKFGDDIICGTRDGRILIEDTGATFDGEAIRFEWKSPFLTLGSPNSRKLIDQFYFLISDTVDNHFRFSVYKDYDTLDAQDQEIIHVTNSANLVWASETTADSGFSWSLEDSFESEENNVPDVLRLVSSADSPEHDALRHDDEAESDVSCLISDTDLPKGDVSCLIDDNKSDVMRHVHEGNLNKPDISCQVISNDSDVSRQVSSSDSTEYDVSGLVNNAISDVSRPVFAENLTECDVLRPVINNESDVSCPVFESGSDNSDVLCQINKADSDISCHVSDTNLTDSDVSCQINNKDSDVSCRVFENNSNESDVIRHENSNLSDVICQINNNTPDVTCPIDDNKSDVMCHIIENNLNESDVSCRVADTTSDVLRPVLDDNLNKSDVSRQVNETNSDVSCHDSKAESDVSCHISDTNLSEYDVSCPITDNKSDVLRHVLEGDLNKPDISCQVINNDSDVLRPVIDSNLNESDVSCRVNKVNSDVSCQINDNNSDVLRQIYDNSATASDVLRQISLEQEAAETTGDCWAISSETVQKAEISNSCIAVQFCIEGDAKEHNFALLGLEYKEITPDG